MQKIKKSILNIIHNKIILNQLQYTDPKMFEYYSLLAKYEIEPTNSILITELNRILRDTDFIVSLLLISSQLNKKYFHYQKKTDRGHWYSYSDIFENPNLIITKKEFKQIILEELSTLFPEAIIKSCGPARLLMFESYIRGALKK